MFAGATNGNQKQTGAKSDPSSETCQNFARTLPKLCPNFARTLRELAQTLPKLCPNFARSEPELCPKPEWKIPLQNLIGYFPITPFQMLSFNQSLFS